MVDAASEERGVAGCVSGCHRGQGSLDVTDCSRLVPLRSDGLLRHPRDRGAAVLTHGLHGMAQIHTEADPSLVERVPQIIHTKFKDQIEFGVPTDEDLCHGGSGRWHGGRRWPARWWNARHDENLDVRGRRSAPGRA